ncbi:hypothetical protein NOR_03186 [Metarhizium rileyi]|uniref:Uncharacterized protein n=1 Tax=Metarhizium rileyi (strain RCEF 4871) TaxID=1649241 RepID=A0A167FKD3_METRR|nr:hypothetical protein NOR_03186 [Metarhizium rileyi RCEF 4871]TWU78267.1 hypothetical protein ED733_008230 [Metarhizium rileyi]
MDTPSPKSTPKRKRDGTMKPSPLRFSFELSRAEAPDDGSGSPRSKVAHRFRGLALGSGGGVVNEEADEETHHGDGSDSARKRQRSDEEMTSGRGETLEQGSESPTPRAAQSVDPEPMVVAGDLTEWPPLPEAASPELDSILPRRKTAGTPPLELQISPKEGKTDAVDDSEPPVLDEDDTIVDPVRAALTWREDEITVYDPDDEDDDGTGINGVGFRPTPAIAHARAIRRRHQMAEYRKREEGEARARRSQRRRGEEHLSDRLQKSPPSRRVRFVDSERQNAVMTMH